MNNKISLFSLTLLIVAAIDSIRTLPTTAFFGSSLVFFYLLAAFFFLIPVGFVSAEFSSKFPDEGGVFHWVRSTLGDKCGLLAVWLQWINTMVWYPTMLLFIAGTASYLVNSQFASSKPFLLAGSLLIFWALTLLNLKGIKTTSKVNSFCGTVGTLIPMLCLIFLGAYWIFSSQPLSISLSWSNLVPTTGILNSSNALVTVMASFLGMELAGVHVGDIKNPQKNFPKAIYYSVLILLITLVLGSLSIAFIVPNQQIHFVDGVMQTFSTLLASFGKLSLVPLFALLIVLGAAGGSINWILSPAKSLMQAAEKDFLPSYFLKKNKHGAPQRILVLQGIVVSIFCLALHFVPSINSYYWFLMALSTGLYMIMYLLLFSAALKSNRPSQGFKVPKGLRSLSCIMGIFSCLLTLFIGLQPSPGASIENKLNYVLLIGVGFILMLSPVFIFWKYQKRRKQLVY